MDEVSRPSSFYTKYPPSSSSFAFLRLIIVIILYTLPHPSLHISALLARCTHMLPPNSQTPLQKLSKNPRATTLHCLLASCYNHFIHKHYTRNRICIVFLLSPCYFSFLCSRIRTYVSAWISTPPLHTHSLPSPPVLLNLHGFSLSFWFCTRTLHRIILPLLHLFIKSKRFRFRLHVCRCMLASFLSLPFWGSLAWLWLPTRPFDRRGGHAYVM